jgi:hypothetical protein
VPPHPHSAAASQCIPEYFVLHELPINLRRGGTAAACATLLLQAVAVIRAKTRANDAQCAGITWQLPLWVGLNNLPTGAA